MPDNTEIARLAELLISRQDAQAQQIELLNANARADQARHEQRMDKMDAAAAADKALHEQRMAKMEADTKSVTTGLTANLARMDAAAAADKALHEQRMAQMDIDSKATAERLETSLAKTDEVLLTFGKVQVGILEQMKGMNGQLLELHQGMTTFFKRQDEFNVIFLEEIREIKTDVRTLKNDVQYLKEVVLQQHEERLQRLEDFMNGTSLRKAS